MSTNSDDYEKALTEILAVIAKYHLTFGNYTELKTDLDTAVDDREIGSKKA